MDKNIAIVGFGYIGSVIGTVLAEKGFNIFGVERDKRIIEAVCNSKSPFNEPGLEDLISKNVKNGRLKVSNDLSVISNCSKVIVTVGTPLNKNYEPNLDQIKDSIESIKDYIKNEQLIILKSTVPPFTTQNIVYPLIKDKKIYLAFCPERLAEGQAIKEFLTIPVIVGGVDQESTDKAYDFWKNALGVEVIKVKDAKTAEMVKLADNLWIDLNIALAHELAKLSDKLKIDVLEVIDAANTLPKVNYNVNILVPSVGVGGYCLTKDPWFVHKLGKEYGLDLKIPVVSRNINDSMPDYAADQINEILLKNNKDPKDIKIAILGIAFKNNTGDCRFTPTRPVIDRLINKGYKVEICDPWVMEHDAKYVTNLPVSNNIEEVIKDSDCVAFLTGHNYFREYSLTKLAELIKPNALIFDGRMFFTKEKINEINSLGLVYKGVGR